MVYDDSRICSDPCDNCGTDANGNYTNDKCPRCDARSKDNKLCLSCQYDDADDDTPKRNHDYVCANHQTMASNCGCLNDADWCDDCGGRKTASVDGLHCRMCNW